MNIAPATQSVTQPRVPDILRRWLLRLAPALAFLILPLLLFWPVLGSERSLVPFDNLYTNLPWSASADQLGITAPHNELLSDLILENYPWKRFARESMRQGELPLWNPHQFAGVPFLAAGQHSMLYPLSWLFLVLPIPQAFGWFTVISLAWAGLSTYLFLRVLGRSALASLLGGLVVQGSGFFTVSVVFPMIVAGAAWLPFVLAMISRLVGKMEAGERHPTAYIPWASLGALGIGATFLAGHVEIAYYVLIVSALWCSWLLLPRGPQALRSLVAWRARTPAVMWAGVMVAVGLMLGAAQFVPLFELVRYNFREGSSTLAEVLDWAWPIRHVTSFLIPDFWGNPARHSVWNIVTHQWEPIRTLTPTSGAPAPLDHVAWLKGLPSWKNYVEAGGYLGILSLALAAVALMRCWRERAVAFFGTLSGVSLLLVFGSPLYALLFYGLPGWRQLHTPFRWIFPLTIAVAVLAAYGFDALAAQRAHHQRARPWRPSLAGLLLGGGGALLAGLVLTLLLPAPGLRVAAALMGRSELTRLSFGESPALLLSYQWLNLLHLALALLGSGLVVWLARRPERVGTWPAWQPLALLVLGADLAYAAAGFTPATPARLADFTPPAIEFLQSQLDPQQPWRFTTLDSDGTLGVAESKVLNANSGMPYDLHDVRGYDSIIPRHYTEFVSAIEDQKGSLLHNRVGPLFWNGSLDSALIDLLGVRYIATVFELDQPGWRRVYAGEVQIYENADPLPRAFLIGPARLPPDRATLLSDLRSLDPRRELLLEAVGGPALAPTPSALPFAPAEIVRYTPNEVTVQVNPAEAGWLVLADTWFPGWKAFTRPAANPEAEETELPIVRANGAFRAVALSPGAQVVRFRYSPDAVKVGFFASFLGVVILMLGAAFWAWGRVYQEVPDEHEVRRVAKNSLAPMALSLLNKGVDTVFAAFMARILGPEGMGSYAFAISIIWYFIIFSSFGLGTLLTREVSRDRGAAREYLTTTITLRLILFVVATPLLIGVVWFWQSRFGLSSEAALAIILLALGLIPSNIADALTAVFRAYEKFEIPALISTISTFLKVGIGAGMLIAGYGIVGLAATSIVTNLATLALLLTLLRTSLKLPVSFWGGWNTGRGRSLLRDAFPLMLNDFLSTAFFRLDKLILQPFWGVAAVGFYDIPYKFIDGLNIIPSTFTLAIFPVMTRYAASHATAGGESLLWRATLLSLRWLVFLALPMALLTTRYAEPIILVFGGAEFLAPIPLTILGREVVAQGSVLALQILIWFLPFSFINSLVHYALIAVNQQRYLTRAFVFGVTFNLAANLIAIRAFSFYGAAAVTIMSEIVLLIPFYRLLRHHIGPIPWAALFWRPGLALAPMAAALWLGQLPFWVAIPLAGLAYLAALLALGAITDDDRTLLARLLPGRARRLLRLPEPA